MFGSLGFPELMLIMFVALIVFGPRRLPEIGRTLGKALGEFKKATDELKNTIEREVRVEELKQIGPTLITPVQSVSRTEPVPVPVSSIPTGAPADAVSEPPAVMADAAVPHAAVAAPAEPAPLPGDTVPPRAV